MSLDNNDKNNREFNEFLQSLQDEVNENEAAASNGKEEPFPFSDSFDIDSFVKENAMPSAQAQGGGAASAEPFSAGGGNADTKHQEPSAES